LKFSGQRLRTAREAAGLSRGELARLARLRGGAAHIWRIENGKTKPGARTLAKLAGAGVIIEWLFEERGEGDGHYANTAND